jgi:zinc/manganese transport system substrate-binding protein
MTTHVLRAAAALVGMGVVLQASGLEAQQRLRLRERGQQLRIVTTLTTYADITRQIVGDRASIVALADAAEDPHFIQPRPGLVLTLRRADLLVATGLDQELWLPALMDRANNPRVASGAPGFVAVSAGIRLMDVPATLSRTEGDIHVYGNPHVWTSPANALIIGRNILVGIKRLDPDGAAEYDARFAAWRERLVHAYVGDELVTLLGVDILADLEAEGRLWSYLSEERYRGRPLADRVGGWLAQGRAFRGREMACYHKEWSYFTRSFGLACAAYIEPKPGIPPTPGHVASVVALMRERRIPVLISHSYYDRQQVRMVAERTGATAVIVPGNVGGGPGADTFIELMTLWVTELARAFGQAR